MANLQSGTRIYGTATIDTSVTVGSGNVTINSSGVAARTGSGNFSYRAYAGGGTDTTAGIFQITDSAQSSQLALFSANTLTAIVAASGSGSSLVFQANATTSMTLAANGGVYAVGTINAASYTVSTSFIANTLGVYHTGVVNAASYAVGTAFTANSTMTNTASLVVSTNTATIGTAAYFVSNGNIGVSGYSTPSFKIDMGNSGGALGATANSQIFYQRYGSTDGNADSLEITNTRMIANTGWDGAGTRLQQKIDATWMAFIQFNGGTGTSYNDSGITFGTGSSTLNGVAVPETMRLASNGNLGIGNTTPVDKLSVNGNAYIQGTLLNAPSAAINAASHTVGTTFIANTTQLTITTPFSANASVGTSGQVLISNGVTGSPYWGTASAGVNTAAQYLFSNNISFGNSTVNTVVNSVVVSVGGVFHENSKTLTSSYTITTGKSAMSVGPLTINSGVVVTIPSGSKWVVL